SLVQAAGICIRPISFSAGGNTQTNVPVRPPGSFLGCTRASRSKLDERRGGRDLLPAGQSQRLPADLLAAVPRRDSFRGYRVAHLDQVAIPAVAATLEIQCA